ncbi:acriflavin resistance protein [Planctomycetaceae bacterium SCGC AG-212-F19]|nr:acriflavin resistance protein [Planctomycetaceae bacterium SCGC AG-212-F19]
MVHKLIHWALHSPLVVILVAVALAAFGSYAFLRVNVEAYPDPAPAIIEVIAQYPGASAEEVERQVTIPLELALAGMPGLKYTRSKSLFSLAHLRNQFDYGIDFKDAKQEVINRLQFVQGLPTGVNPMLSPESPTGEIYRYTLRTPKDLWGREVYTLNDIKALQDWVLQREFRRVPRIADVTSSGGTVKRYEICPDPERLKRYGITLGQVQIAISNSNGNVSGDYLVQGHTVQVVRGVGLIGGGQDPMEKVLGMRDPSQAAAFLRAEEQRRIEEIRDIVIASINNVPVRVDDIVEGGPVRKGQPSIRGVVVGYQTRLGKVCLSRPASEAAPGPIGGATVAASWLDEEDKVQGIVLLRKNDDSLPALHDVEAKVNELNENPGRLLPGVTIEPYYDRTELINVTTETVRENLLVGMTLVTLILLMFLSNVRSALIVAINIPLALLFAFSVLFLRGKSANLLSIGAVDFGIIVDSSVIMVENIYRHISSGECADLPLRERILRACREVERGLFFSTAIMVCAFIPLFTMQGPEGQIFGPMADTYAFALGGALLLALTLSPVLCLIFFRNLPPAEDNFLVRWLKRSYLRQLEVCLQYRWITLGVFGAIIALTLVAAVPRLGREFMPELEEGNLWIRGTFPINISLDEVAGKVRIARSIMKEYEEVKVIVVQMGRPDDGTDPTGFNNVEFFVPLKPDKYWPIPPGRNRPRTKPELVEEMNNTLTEQIIGVDWNFSQNIRDNVMEALSGVKGDNSIKIIGPDLDKLEKLAEQVKAILLDIPGIDNVGVFRIKGQSNLEFRVDRKKCARWGVSATDVETVIDTALRGKAFTQMTEGEKLFDITLRWPESLRYNENKILEIPVNITNNTVTAGLVGALPQTPLTGPSGGISPSGTSLMMPALTGSQNNATLNNIGATPRRRLGDLVSPVGDNGDPDPEGQYLRAGASTIYREQGRRLIAVKFSVRGRDLAGAVADAQQKTAELFKAPYRAEWSGEFQEMEEAERRLLFIIPLSLGLILVLLYLAFNSLLDVVVVLSNVVALSIGGVWALLLTHTNFSISAAVGFISIFGVAIMDGLLSVAYFNRLRADGLPCREAIMQGAAKRVRPMMMTALTAVFGLLPAALSTRIGAQTQQPLAIVVVGGMIMTLLLNRFLMPVLYSFYGHREPTAAAGGLTH